ncbi:MAG TPA: hypothetical protein VMT18_13395 [Planctomycetota bacterium]|nr:hypothetical protein [Planctomycetota bacterium]
MSAPCDSFRDDYLAVDPSERSGAHRSSCEPCERWARRVEARERALNALERRTAPTELDGAVVAALEAGFRQERVVDAVLGLGRVSSPRALDHALSGELIARESDLPSSLPAARRLSAPAELAGLVSQELGDLAGHRARRFVGSLQRLTAPAELAERLAEQEWTRARRPALRPLGVLGLGALAVAVLALGFALRDEAPRQPRYDFVVEVVDDPAQFAGLGAGLLDGVSGGFLSAGRR